MNTTSAFGFPLVNCNGVMNWMGLSISVDDCFPTAFVVDLSGVNNGPSSPSFSVSLLDLWLDHLIHLSMGYLLFESTPQSSPNFSWILFAGAYFF
jgi:hypothetical protein